MGLASTLRFVAGHPLNRGRRARAIGHFLRWQVAGRIWAGPRVVPFAGGARLLVERGNFGATGNVYCGLHEFEDMALVIHALRPGDTFFDVGANVGSYTVLAAAVAGARVTAFEPVPVTFRHLEDNVHLNRIADRVEARNVAVGRERGTLRFTAAYDAGNHVATSAEARSAGPATKTVDVPVIPLDELAGGAGPAVIKIDVEGFETEVIAGARRVLGAEGLLAVLMELNGSGARYGYDEAAVHRTMIDLGFKPYRYAPFERELRSLDGVSNAMGGNTLYVRDLARLSDRVKTAAPVAVHGTRV